MCDPLVQGVFVFFSLFGQLRIAGCGLSGGPLSVVWLHEVQCHHELCGLDGCGWLGVQQLPEGDAQSVRGKRNQPGQVAADGVRGETGQNRDQVARVVWMRG